MTVREGRPTAIFNIERPLYEKLQQRAHQHERSLSAELRLLVRESLESSARTKAARQGDAA